MKPVLKRILVAVPLAMLMALPLAAQDLRSLDNRLNRLERDLIDLQRSYYGDAQAPATAPSGSFGGNAADMSVRVDQLETEIRRLTGRMEELDYRLRNLERDNQVTSRSDGYVAAPADNGTYAAAPADDGTYATAAAEPVDDNRTATVGTLGTLNSSDALVAGQRQVAALASQDPTSQYESARRLLGKREFEAAGTAFTRFLDANPDHREAPNAYYWLGESRFQQGEYEEAANAYLDGYRIFPDSSRAADSLLKLGMSLAALGQQDDACLTYEEVLTSYPGASAQTRRRVNIEQRRANC